MSMEHVDDLIDLEALGALDAEESAFVRAHVADCPRCQAQLEGALEAASQLALSVPLHPASERLRARVLMAVQAEATPTPIPLTPRTGRVPQAIMRFNRRWGAVAAAVFLVPLAGLLTWNYVLQRQVNDLKAESRRIDEAQKDNIVFVLPTAVRAQMVPTEQAGATRGFVSWNPDEGKCMVRVRDLPRVDGTSYHVFYQGRMAEVDAGELKPDDAGVADLIFDASKWKGGEYTVWVSAVRPAQDPTMLLQATIRRE